MPTGKKRRPELEGVAALRERRGLTRNDPGFTVLEYAAKFGVAYQAARAELRGMVEAGELVMGLGRRKVGMQMRRVNVFREK